MSPKRSGCVLTPPPPVPLPSHKGLRRNLAERIGLLEQPHVPLVVVRRDVVFAPPMDDHLRRSADQSRERRESAKMLN